MDAYDRGPYELVEKLQRLRSLSDRVTRCRNALTERGTALNAQLLQSALQDYKEARALLPALRIVS